MKCKICSSDASLLFKDLVLNKYEASYYKCENCDFIQTEKPFWLNESYNNAITDLDVGLVSRNLAYADVLEKIIKNTFDRNGKFLDYAGGYGLFVRLMRDKGFDFYREDKYCENIFAQHHDLDNIGEKNRFEVLTAFEIFEHLENPLEDIEKMLGFSDTIIFSTDLQPVKEIRSIKDWWYFTPETGQHIAFYSEKTLRYIAESLHLSFYSNGNLHLFSSKEFKINPLLCENVDNEKKMHQMESLIQSDFELAKNIILKTDEIKIETKKQKNGNPKGDLKEDFIYSLSVALAKLNSAKSDLNLKKSELDLVNSRFYSAMLELESVSEQLNLTKFQLDSVNEKLTEVYLSREWKAALVLRKYIKILIPVGSLRRRIVVKFWHLVKLLLKAVKNLKSKNRRKINTKSKKIVYIGHSYHGKTKSTEFLIDYLKQFYEVEIILDESWIGKPYPDLSFIDESYLGVIFFQLLPSDEILESIKNDNIIFFPMFDQTSGWDENLWKKYKGMKIVNFSKTLDAKLKKWGFETIAVQFFPKPQDFIPGEKDEVFFWQRLTNININTVTKIFGKENLKIHIHRTIDPQQEFIMPNKEKENKFSITYSDWFETREEMWDLIKQKAIYVAPREYEGIGMSFLEAMALGKAVIAVNNPTMNEYIEHGKNGYLFDLAKLEEIDLSNIEKVQKTTYKFMKEGFIRWEREKSGIIEFIKKS